MDSAKLKIKSAVATYMLDMPEEFELLKHALEMRRKMLREGVNWMEGTDGMPMYELSEELQLRITLALNSEELTWWKTTQGGRWFIKTFPVFSLQNY